MFSLILDCTTASRDFLIAELWESGVAGIVETDAGLKAFFEDDADRNALAARFGAVVEPSPVRDWVAESREYLQPMRVGQRFFLVPEWRDDPAPQGRIRIRVNSGLAFGTGAHETTRLCLEALEELVRPGMTVVDIGTGSGILTEAAARLGAARLIACDIDPLAVAVATQNLRDAGIPAEVFEGSASQVETAVADLIIGNISPEWLVLLAPEWKRIGKSGAVILLSGLESADVERVSVRLREAGLAIERILVENEWRALVARTS